MKRTHLIAVAALALVACHRKPDEEDASVLLVQQRVPFGRESHANTCSGTLSQAQPPSDAGVPGLLYGSFYT